MTERFFKAAAWSYLFALLILTVIPADERPVLGFRHELEHFIAFAPAGILFGVSFAGRTTWLYPGALAFTLLLELSQIALPSRHARISDFVIDAAAACLGLAVAQLFEKTTKDDISADTPLKAERSCNADTAKSS